MSTQERVIPPEGTKFKIILKIQSVVIATPKQIYFECTTTDGVVSQTPPENATKWDEPLLLCKETISFSKTLNPIVLALKEPGKAHSTGKSNVPVSDYLCLVPPRAKKSFAIVVTLSKSSAITAHLILSVARDKERDSPPSLHALENSRLASPPDDNTIKLSPKVSANHSAAGTPGSVTPDMKGARKKGTRPGVDKKIHNDLELKPSKLGSSKPHKSRDLQLSPRKKMPRGPSDEDHLSLLKRGNSNQAMSTRLTDLLGGSQATRPVKTLDDSGVNTPNDAFTPGTERAVKYKTIDGIVGHDRDLTRKKDGAITRSKQVESCGSLNEFRANYLKERTSADQKYLTDVFLGTDIRSCDQFSFAFIIFQSLQFWEAFKEPDSPVLAQTLEVCLTQVIECGDSHKSLFVWIENLTALSISIDGEIRAGTIEPKIYAKFQKQLHEVLTKAFEAILPNAKDKVVLMEAITGAINSSNANEALSTLFSLFQQKYKMWVEPSFFPENRKHFWSCLFHTIIVLLFESLTNLVVTMTEGIKLKMIIGRLEQWVADSLGGDLRPLFQELIEPVKEAANVLCLGSKGDLANESVRHDVWPSLEPRFILKLLKMYRTEPTEKIPPALFTQLTALSKNWQPTGAHFHAEKPPKYSVDYHRLRVPEYGTMQLPKSILERPGFGFLKTILEISQSQGDDMGSASF